MNDMRHRPFTALLLCAALLIALSARADSDDAANAEHQGVELEAQADALAADADKQCAKQPKHSRQACHAQIERAVQRLRAKAALAR